MIGEAAIFRIYIDKPDNTWTERRLRDKLANGFMSLMDIFRFSEYKWKCLPFNIIVTWRKLDVSMKMNKIRTLLLLVTVVMCFFLAIIITGAIAEDCRHVWLDDSRCVYCYAICEHQELDEEGNCALCGAISISEDHFPDPVFRAWLKEETKEYCKNGFLPRSYYESYAIIDVPEGVCSIRGCEWFNKLNLNWWACPLQELDVSGFRLHSLRVSGPELTKLVIGKQEDLNDIQTSDYDGCPKLKDIDVTGCPNLMSLVCDVRETKGIPFSELKKPDVRNCKKLKQLHLQGRQAGELDISQNTELENLVLTNAGITEIDLSNHPELNLLGLDDNLLTTLDVSKQLKLEHLFVQHNALESIELGSKPVLRVLFLVENHFSSIDLSNCPALEQLDLMYCSKLSKVDVSHLPELNWLRVSCGVPILELDVRNNPELETLIIRRNALLTSIDLTNNKKLKYLDCENTRITELDLTQNTLLEELEIYGTPVSHIDLSNCLQPLQLCYMGRHMHVVNTIDGKLDLTTLNGFDPARASNWQGGNVEDNILTFTGSKADYTYDCGQGTSCEFSLVRGGTTEGYNYIINEDGTACITGCTASGNIVIPDELDGYTITGLADYLFSARADITSITIPASVTQMGERAFAGCKKLTRIEVNPENMRLTSFDGVLYSKDLSYLYGYPCAKPETEYHVPEETTWIDCETFDSVSYLRDLYLEGKDTTWATFSFANVNCLTVHYRKGGRTELLVRELMEAGMASDDGVYLPFYMSFGEDDGSNAEAYKEKAKQIIEAVIAPSMTDWQKARALHDWIIQNAHYSLKYNDETGILVYGMGHCEAYSKTYKYLLDLVGIENRLVEGKIRYSSVGHMWNQVKINNIWYHVDCTWDDPVSGDYDIQENVSGLEGMEYFMVSGQRLSQSRTWKTFASDVSGWNPTSSGMTFLDADGNRITGLLQVDGETFCFNSDGLNIIGVYMIDQKQYWFESVCVYQQNGVDYNAGKMTKSVSIRADLIIPSAIKRIETEAFTDVRNVRIYLPSGIQFIGESAFDPSVTIICDMNSYAETRCKELGYKVEVI